MSGIFVAKLLPLISSNTIFTRLVDKEKYISKNIISVGTWLEHVMAGTQWEKDNDFSKFKILKF